MKNKKKKIMSRILVSPLSLLLLLILLLLNSSEADDVGIYWDQGRDQGTLTETCATGTYSYVIIHYFDSYNSTLGTGLEGSCSTPNGCTQIGTEIRNCQKQGIKVMLSIRIGYLASSADAKNVSNYLWNNFLGGSSSSRPFGDVVFDGIDFDIQQQTPHLKDLAFYLKPHTSTQHAVYLSASPNCQFPDPILGTTLDTGLFDYVWVQFFDSPLCSYDQGNFDILVISWNLWANSFQLAKLFLSLPAAKVSSKTGYIPADVLVSKMLRRIKNSSNYGGVMRNSNRGERRILLILFILSSLVFIQLVILY